MRNMLFNKGLRTALAVVLSAQMALGNVVPVLADETLAAIANEINEKNVYEPTMDAYEPARDAYTPSKPILDSSWELENGNDNLAVNADGSITITTEGGTIGDKNMMNNVIYHKLDNATDYEFTVKVDGKFQQNYQGAYLMITSGKKLANVVGVTRRYHGYFKDDYGTSMLMGMQHEGDIPEFYMGAEDIGDSFYLKLKKNNSSITGYFAKEYSDKEEDWTRIVDNKRFWSDKYDKPALVAADEIYIALAAANGGGDTETDVTFSDVRVNGNPIALVTDINVFYSLEVAGEEDAHMDIEDTMQLSLLGHNKDTSIKFTKFDKVTYTSSNERVAKVDGNGVVTGLDTGRTVITAEAMIGDVSRTATYALQVGEVASENSWKVESPNGNISMEAILMNDGTLSYTAKRGDEVTIPESPAGLVTNLGDFSNNLVFKESSEVKEINETYDVITGKHEKYTNHCFEKVVTFTLADDDSVEFDFIMRAYDDGTAFRYRIRTKEEKELRISKETSGLRIPEETDLYYMNYSNSKWNYEGEYTKQVARRMATGATPSMPLLYKSGKDNVWTLFTEADLHGTYCGSMFTVEQDGLFRVTYAKSQVGDVVTTAPFQSPWRVAITGTPEDIVENTLVENLNPAANEAEYKFREWVDPGLSSWSWVTNWGQGVSDQTKKETHMNWIDLAAEMGWEYYILDEGWQPRANNNRNAYEGYRDWFYEVRDYAKQKGVKLCAWVRVNDIRNAEDRRARFEQWSKDGIVAIKADFFDSEGQETIQLYDDLYKDAAKYKLMVNCHGANKPTGEIRTYPNVFAREAIRGQEAGGITAHQYTVIPFIRAAIGPADVTEELKSKDYNKTTMGFQIALTALFEDGIHSMGSAPDVYRSNKVAVDYYKNYPDHWDKTEYVNGEIGTYVNMARKYEDEWYVSGISVDTRMMRIPLDFLDDAYGYEATIYQEDGRQAIKKSVDADKLVTTADTLEIPVLDGGGYAVRLVPKKELDPGIKTLETIELEEGSEELAEVTVTKSGVASKEVIWSSADENIATVTSTGNIRGVKAGKTIITIKLASDETVKAEIAVTVTPAQHIINAGKWRIFKKNSNVKINDDNSISIITEAGVLGDTPSTHDNLFGMEVPEGDKDFEITAKISGGMSANYQGGFVVAFDGDNPNENYVAAGRRYHSYIMGEHPQAFSMMSKDKYVSEFYCEDEKYDSDVYVKLEKKDAEFNGYFSYDGKTWENITKKGVKTNVTQNYLATCKNLCVGFYAGSGGRDNPIEITFSEFTYNGKEIPVAYAIYELCEEFEAAQKALAEAEKAKAEAEQKATDAEKAKNEATQKAEEAEKAKDEAIKKAEEAEKAKDEATKKSEEAEKAKDAATQKAEEAEKAKDEAIQKAEEAEKAKSEAEKAQSEAEQKAETAQKAQTEAEQKAETAEKGQSEAEQKAEAAEKAQTEAEQKAEAAEKAQSEAEQKAEAAQKAQTEAEQKAQEAEKAQTEAEQKAQEAEKAQTEAEQKAQAAEKAQSEAEQKAQAAEDAKAEAEQKAQAAESAKTEATQKAEAAGKAQTEAEQKAEAAGKAQSAAEQKAETAEKNQIEAEQKAEAAEKAKTEAEQKAQAAEKAQNDAEQKAQAAVKAQQEAEQKTETVQAGDMRVVGNLIYEITDTTNKTVSVCGSVKSKLAQVVIPDTITIANQEYKVTSIEESAFEESKSLKKVVIGANVEKIGKRAFYKAKKLKTVQITSEVLETVGKDAFKGIHKKAKVQAAKSKVKSYKKLTKVSKMAALKGKR